MREQSERLRPRRQGCRTLPPRRPPAARFDALSLLPPRRLPPDACCRCAARLAAGCCYLLELQRRHRCRCRRHCWTLQLLYQSCCCCYLSCCSCCRYSDCLLLMIACRSGWASSAVSSHQRLRLRRLTRHGCCLELTLLTLLQIRQRPVACAGGATGAMLCIVPLPLYRRLCRRAEAPRSGRAALDAMHRMLTRGCAEGSPCWRPPDCSGGWRAAWLLERWHAVLPTSLCQAETGV